MFDLETLKEKLDGETLAALGNHINDLTGSRDAAKRESIEGRKALKEKAESLQSAQNRIFEKLGIESLDDLDTLPDPKSVKGDADAIKQFEAKLKRFERERDDAVKGRDAMVSQMTQAKKQSAIAQAISAGGFFDTKSARFHLESATEQQDDEFMFKTNDGRLIPLSDGAKLIAAEMPHLVNKIPSGTGSGHRDTGGASAAKTMPKTVFDALRPSERAEAMSKGFAITET